MNAFCIFVWGGVMFMSILLINTPEYYCRCDICNRLAVVKRTINIYNGAQAVRSLGWSFGKDGGVACDRCRRLNRNDHYKMGKW